MSYSSFSAPIFIPRRKFWLGALLLAGVMLAGLNRTAWADTIYLYNGQILDAKVIEVSGDIIRYRQGLKTVSVPRMQVANRMDMIQVRNNHTYVGEIHYIDSMMLEMKTSTGVKTFFKYLIKDIRLGTPHSMEAAWRNQSNSTVQNAYTAPHRSIGGNNVSPVAHNNPSTQPSKPVDYDDPGSLRRAKQPMRSQYYRKPPSAETSSSVSNDMDMNIRGANSPHSHSENSFYSHNASSHYSGSYGSSHSGKPLVDFPEE